MVPPEEEDVEIIGMEDLADIEEPPPEKTYTQAEVDELLKKKQSECLAIFVNTEIELEVITVTGDFFNCRGYFSRSEIGDDGCGRLPYLRFQVLGDFR